MALQTKTKAAFDASAHLTNIPTITFRRFLASLLKDAEAIAVELENLRDEWTGAGSTRSAGTSGSASSIGITGVINAEDLSAWASAYRDSARAIANEIAGLAERDPNNHTHAGVSDIIVTDVTGAGLITNKVYFNGGTTSPANAQLQRFQSDNDNITITFQVYAHGANWQPLGLTASLAGSADVISLNEDWTQQGSGRVFEGSVTFADASSTGLITLATPFSGDQTTVTYTRGADPTATALRLHGGLMGFNRSRQTMRG